MEHFKNQPESFFREIRSIEIYKASDITFLNNSKGIFPILEEPLYKFDISPETFDRKIKPKTKDGNYFYNIDVSFSLLDLSKETVDKCYEYFNKKDFAIVLISNTEKMMLGNDREPLKVEFIDNLKDDNSGNDEHTIAISGDTVIPPKTKKL